MSPAPDYRNFVLLLSFLANNNNKESLVIRVLLFAFVISFSIVLLKLKPSFYQP